MGLRSFLRLLLGLLGLELLATIAVGLFRHGRALGEFVAQGPWVGFGCFALGCLIALGASRGTGIVELDATSNASASPWLVRWYIEAGSLTGLEQAFFLVLAGSIWGIGAYWLL
ncbi:hypothetical protein HNQ50_003688 [Silvimonas terrae]|uniref:Uncharacterized protein n=1 Tax=Silvimonas terrae TaxID=300266 RepID=A0A840RK21_9NEIS|nr:hypothetical protein [Silvimonas terrae]